MEKKTYILVYGKHIAETDEVLHFSTLGVYLLYEEEMASLGRRIAVAFSKLSSTRTDGLAEYAFFKEAEVTPYEQAEKIIKEAFTEQRIKINF